MLSEEELRHEISWILGLSNDQVSRLFRDDPRLAKDLATKLDRLLIIIERQTQQIQLLKDAVEELKRG